MRNTRQYLKNDKNPKIIKKYTSQFQTDELSSSEGKFIQILDGLITTLSLYYLILF